MSAVQLFVLGWATALSVIAFVVLARLVWTLYWITKDYFKESK